MRNYFRLHACCNPIHPALDCLEALIADLGPKPHEIDRIDVATYRFASIMQNPEPSNYFASKYSLPPCGGGKFFMSPHGQPRCIVGTPFLACQSGFPRKFLSFRGDFAHSNPECSSRYGLSAQSLPFTDFDKLTLCQNLGEGDRVLLGSRTSIRRHRTQNGERDHRFQDSPLPQGN